MSYTRKATVFGKEEREKDKNAKRVSKGIHTSSACIDNKGQANGISETLEEPFSWFSCTLFTLAGRCSELAFLDRGAGGASPPAERVLVSCALLPLPVSSVPAPGAFWHSNVLLQRSRDIQALLFSYEPAAPGPRADGLLVSAFDVGVILGWRVSFVTGMCRTARRSQFEKNALDILGVRGPSAES